MSGFASAGIIGLVNDAYDIDVAKMCFDHVEMTSDEDIKSEFEELSDSEVDELDDEFGEGIVEDMEEGALGNREEARRALDMLELSDDED